jgi:hypothetical protein
LTPHRWTPRPQDKHKLYLNRYNLLLQRLRRNRRFQPPNPLQAAAGAAPQAQLTELMGLKGNAGETCIVMGIIGSQVGWGWEWGLGWGCRVWGWGVWSGDRRRASSLKNGPPCQLQSQSAPEEWSREP